MNFLIKNSEQIQEIFLKDTSEEFVMIYDGFFYGFLGKFSIKK